MSTTRFAFAKGLRVTRRGATPRRLAAAKRFLGRELERHALFADDVAAEQPTPEQRIAGFDDGFAEWQQDARLRRAQLWRRARQQIAQIADEQREWLVDAWNRSGQPKHPECLLGHLSTYLPECLRRMAAGEKWFVFAVGEAMRILLWNPQHAPKTSVAGPFDNYLAAVQAANDFASRRAAA